MFTKLYDLSFKIVCKYLCPADTYRIFEELNCFDIIDKLNNERCVNPCDSIDLSSFFRFLKINKIIIEGKEFIFDNKPSTHLLVVDYNSEDIHNFHNKIEKYRKEYVLDGDYIFEYYYGEGKSDFVLCGYKDKDYFDAEEIKKILEKCDGVK